MAGLPGNAMEKCVKIEAIDKNFRDEKSNGSGIAYHDALKDPFELEGFPWRDSEAGLRRLPLSLTDKEVNAGVLSLAMHCAGGVIRFRTSSHSIALRAGLECASDMSHMPRSGSMGFDLYGGSGKDMKYHGSGRPSAGAESIDLELCSNLPGTMEDWTLYLPLYSGVSKIEIGLAGNAEFQKPTPRAVARPVLFYGSSITQGGCASRPGNAYPAMLCRAIDAPQINLGFSGSAKGESAIAEAIAGLDLAAFVMDYDHNAPNVQHLNETHERFFRIVRAGKPDLPIIIVSKCDFKGGNDVVRRDVLRRTYENAFRAGDRRTCFVDGERLFGTEFRDACTVDGCHPNDLGFYRIFSGLLPFLQAAIDCSNEHGK